MQSRFSILLSLLLSIVGYAEAQQRIFKTYTVQDGLVANPVRRIFQDSKGFIWIATWEGLSKYDGHKFSNFTMANGLSFNLVNDIYETKDGKLYVAENNGITDIIRNDVVIQRAPFQTTINRFFTLANKQVIVGTDADGLHEFRNNALIKIHQSVPQLSHHYFTQWNDTLLVSGLEDSMRIFNGKYELIAERKTDFFLYCLYADSKKRVWAGTSKGLMLLSPLLHQGKITFLPPPPPFNITILNNASITSFNEDEFNNFWIGTTNGLLFIGADGQTQLYTDKDGLPTNQVNCFFQDKEKNIWIGTTLGLVKLVTKNNIRIYNTGHGLSAGSVFDLLRLNKNEVLVTTPDGIKLFNDSSNNFLNLPMRENILYSGFVKNSTEPILFSQDGKIAGTQNSFNRQLNLESGVQLYAVVKDDNQNIFAGTTSGLYLSTKKRIIAIPSLPYRIHKLLLDKKGNLWIGTWNNGLYIMKYSIADDTINTSVKDLSQFAPDKGIRSFYEDSKGNIWAGTRYFGVICIRNQEGKAFDVKRWDLHQGLMSGWISAIAEDAEGNIWLGSNLGLDKLALRDTGFRIVNFSRLNNFYSGIGAILPGSNNKNLILGTSSGLVVIRDDQIEAIAALPVYITSVILGSGKNKLNPSPGEKNISISYRQNQAQFEFTAPGFINEKQVLYSYRLLGSEDTAWSQPANVYSVSYASLQPGRYRFEARTLGLDGNFGRSSAFNFIIHPPFWQTIWFIGICVMALGALFYIFYRYRINQLLKIQQVRNRIATDLHDDIGSSLTNISLLSELSNKNIQNPQQARIFIERISEEVNSSGQALDDIVWSINAQNDSLEQMLARMRRYAAEIFDATGISYTLQMEEQFASRKLNMEQRRDVFLIYKEGLNNIYKHAGAKEVRIKLHIEKKCLHLNIADDGKGFDTTATTHRNGLKNMQHRAAKWKGYIRVVSFLGKGTSIEMSMPLS